MKLFKTVAVIIILFAAISNLQSQSDKIRIILQQPPPGKFGVVDIWSISLTNTTNENLTIHVGGTASEEKDGLIIEAKSKPFTIKPGTTKYKHTDFSNAEIKYNNGKYKEILMRTGNAPEGNYTICVTAFNEQGEVVGQENCIMQNIILGIEKEIILLNPCETVRVDYNEPLIFTWMPLPDVRKYTFKLYEIKGEKVEENDTSYDFIKKDINENEIINSKPVYERDEITGASFQLPASGYKFGEGKRYAWGIWAGDMKSRLCWILPVKHSFNTIYKIAELTQNSKTISKTTLDSSGNFKFENIPNGEYQLKISLSNGTIPEKFLLSSGNLSVLYSNYNTDELAIICVGKETPIKGRYIFSSDGNLTLRGCMCCQPDCCCPIGDCCRPGGKDPVDTK